MKIYLAARFGRQAEMREVRTRLVSLGFDVVSRWLDEEFSQRADGKPPDDSHRQTWSTYDFDDVSKCDVMVNFTEIPGTGGTGGRHVEFGLAAAWGKRLVVVGYKENVFHHLPQVKFVKTLDAAIDTLVFMMYLSGEVPVA